ncbi:MAG: ubiquitin-like domain-containing protein [Chloroflexota bacterium]|nr:ubiquitin-like domain-containing protein [Chloroflexota bacterium]
MSLTPEPDRHVLRTGWLYAARDGLLLDPRRRPHLAVLSVIILVSVFGYGLLQPRKVRVEADGREIVLSTRDSNDSAVLRGAGVVVHDGDRVTSLWGREGDVLRVERSHRVVLQVDGVAYEMGTHAITIDQLLAEAGVALAGRDSVLQNGTLVAMNAPVEPPRLFGSRTPATDAPPSGAIDVAVRRAVPFTIVEDGAEVSTTSSRLTVAQVLREAGKVIGPGDALTPDAQAPLDADARIELRHAKDVTVALPDEHRVLYTLSNTVGEALSAAGIEIPSGAFTEPSLDTMVTAGMAVRVVQLSASSDEETEYLESKTVYESDASLAPGETRTVAGHDGTRIRRFDVSYVNGEEAGRTLIDEQVDAPVDTVIYYPVQRGTGETQPAEEGSGDVRRTLRVYATWYNPASSGRSSSDPAYGHTATGAVVTYGIVAVDPDVIPLGTKMFIPGYGYAVAADTGGAVKGYVIDLGYPDGVQVDWQSKWVEIQILS